LRLERRVTDRTLTAPASAPSRTREINSTVEKGGNRSRFEAAATPLVKLSGGLAIVASLLMINGYFLIVHVPLH